MALLMAEVHHKDNFGGSELFCCGGAVHRGDGHVYFPGNGFANGRTLLVDGSGDGHGDVQPVDLGRFVDYLISESNWTDGNELCLDVI